MYSISHYNDLDWLLGNQWRMRVLNINGDFFLCNLGHSFLPPLIPEAGFSVSRR